MISHKRSQLSVGGHMSIIQVVRVASQADMTFIHRGVHMDQASGYSSQASGHIQVTSRLFTHSLCVNECTYE